MFFFSLSLHFSFSGPTLQHPVVSLGPQLTPSLLPLSHGPSRTTSRPWPKQKLLAHPSPLGFLTTCGPAPFLSLMPLARPAVSLSLLTSTSCSTPDLFRSILFFNLTLYHFCLYLIIII